jgi:hypothetical protein
MNTKKIPRIMHTIWIGNESERPDDLLQTWKDKHPEWEYKLWGNKDLNFHKWTRQPLIDVYLREKRYPGVADIMRYEILYYFGGFMHPADSECLHSVNELIEQDCDAIAVYENEKVRPGLVSPLYASTQGNKFTADLTLKLPLTPPKTKAGKSKAPWQVTGNAHMRNMIKHYQPERLLILPSHTFNPIHHTGLRYEGDEKVYAVQKWASTSNAGIGVQNYNWR